MQAAHFVPEAVDASAQSIADSLSDLYALVPKLGMDASADKSAYASVNDLLAHVSRFADTAAHLDLTGLNNVQARLMERVLPFANAESLSEEFTSALEEWLQLNFNYLAAPSIRDHWSPLIDFLNRPLWSDALSEGQMAILNRLFEVSAQRHAESLLTTPESAPPIIDARAADVIAASLDAIANSGSMPVLDLDALDAELLDLSGLEAGESPDEGDTRIHRVLDRAPAVNSQSDTSLDEAVLDVPSSVAELVAMIREELHSSEESLHGFLQAAATAALAGEQPTLEDYRWQIERLANATEAVGLKGLHELLGRILESTCLIESGDVREVPRHCEILDHWPALVTQYLDHLGDAVVSQSLLDYITALEFALPLEEDTARALLNNLRHPELEATATEETIRPAQATPEYVSLSVPGDINPELLDSMLHELPSQTQEFSGALQRIASGAGDLEDLRVAQRVAHTLKGSANTVGIRGVAELAHHLEDIFLALQEREALPPKQLSRVLVDAADCLEAMCEALVGVGPPPSQALTVLQEVLDWANRIDREGLPADSLEVADVEQDRLPMTPELGVGQSTVASYPATVDPQPIVAQRIEAQTSLPTLRVATTHVDDLLRLSGESKIVGGQLKEGLRRVESQLTAVRRQNLLFQQLVNELEQLVDIRGITMPRLSMTRRGNTEFDALEMDQYSELHTVSRRLAEVAMDSREWSSAAQGELHSLEDLLLSQVRHGNDTQEAILKMRMVPATTIVGRLQRGVRQTCRLLDKDVELSVNGAETLIDGDSLNQLVDPLMHLMRNAIDHGIESSEQRVAVGKSSQGHLTIEFGREGTQIVVRCVDDGRGLDYAAIRATAEARGLISANASLTEAQLGRLIVEPGFSTRDEVTQVSGRGIGLDIVHSRVAELKGTFDVQSQQGRGCRFIIRLPATLISAHALLVKHGKHTVAVASRGVRQILDAQAGKLSSVGDELSLQVGDEVYEAYRLESLLGRTIERRDGERGPRPALLIEVSADRICAVLVQAVVDTIDLVVKPLGTFVPRSVGMIGATILGDGGVAPVMDLPDLLRAGKRERASRDTLAKNSHERFGDRSANKPQLPSVLVVDDSLSVRRAMEQLLKDAGFEVRLARDGLEAVAILDVKQPDLLLVDLEMPRMNGMELTAHVRNRQATRHLPVIMITSRSTEKHRKQAEAAGVNHYLTKPYAEDVLLEHVNAFLRRSV